MRLPLSQRSSCSGSVMAEACIGLALMVFAWIMITYTLFMATNHTRTAMAARHAAWFKGAGGTDATAAQIDNSFFFQPGLTKVEYGKGEGIVSSLSGGLSEDDKKIKDGGKGPFLATVTFGISTNEIDSTDKFPFTLLKTKVPFMPDSRLATGLSVKSSCQWEETGETWSKFMDAIKGMYDSLKDMITDLVLEMVTP
jgi:hypothetical protein